MKTAIARFLEKVGDKSSGCWHWAGAKKPSGYGNFYLNRKYCGAHVASFVLHGGVLKDGMYVMHKCDNPSCVNPDHLTAGLPIDNTKDMIRKNRAPKMFGNSEAAPAAKLKYSDVREIRKLLAGGSRGDDLAKAFNVSQACISLIKNNRTWRMSDSSVTEHGVRLPAPP